MKKMGVVVLAAFLATLFFSGVCLADARSDLSKAMQLAVKQGKVDEAIAVLDGIIDNPSGVKPELLSGAYNFRGLCNQAREDNAKALADFGKAIEVDPHNADAFGNRAFVYQSMGDIAKAKEDAKAARRIDRKVKVPEFK